LTNTEILVGVLILSAEKLLTAVEVDEEDLTDNFIDQPCRYEHIETLQTKCNDDTINLTARDEDGDKDLTDNLFTVCKRR